MHNNTAHIANLYLIAFPPIHYRISYSFSRYLFNLSPILVSKTTNTIIMNIFNKFNIIHKHISIIVLALLGYTKQHELDAGFQYKSMDFIYIRSLSNFQFPIM